MKTFQQICPRWSKKLNSKNPGKPSIVDHKRLDISKEKACVVGEAWGFTDRYQQINPQTYCGECWKHCIDIASNFYMMFVHPDVTIDIDRFVEHWNKEHLNQK